MGLGQYNASPNVNVQRFYFSGTTQLRKGQVLVFDSTASKTATDPQTRLGSQVVDVATSSSNNNYVAGIVPDYEGGKTGPRFVDLIVPAPSSIFDVEVDGTTDVAAGDPLKPDNSKGALIKDGSVAVGVTYARALEAQAADSKVVIRCMKF